MDKKISKIITAAKKEIGSLESLKKEDKKRDALVKKGKKKKK